jgi:hypothetical protein
MPPEDKPKKRGSGRPWQKGQSGNPGGLSYERREYLKALRNQEKSFLDQAVVKLRELALQGHEWALRDYLDRFGVRMPEKLELSGEDGAPLVPAANPLDPSTMTSEQVRKRLEAIRSERAQLLAAVVAQDAPRNDT